MSRSLIAFNLGIFDVVQERKRLRYLTAHFGFPVRQAHHHILLTNYDAFISAIFRSCVPQLDLHSQW